MFDLSRIRVLDVSQVLAGPFAAQLLGDLGCDVIKVEPPTGDATRTSFGAHAAWGESPGYLSVNRSKRSLAIDLKAPEGLEAFRRLAATSDVVIENFRPGVADRLGISYRHLEPINPRIVYLSISGFGSTGPYADRAGYDIIAQAMSGIMSVTGEEGGAPARAGVPVADLSTGIFGVVGILGALVQREATGRGALVEANLLDSALAYSVWEASGYWAYGEIPTAHGSRHPLNAPYQAFKCKDGYVTVGANNDKLWQRLCAALGHPEWREDPRFATPADRVRNVDELETVIESALADLTRAEVEALLLEAELPVGSVRRYDEVLTDEESRPDGMVQHATYAGFPVRMLASPIKFDGQRLGQGNRPPRLGEHTEEVLRSLGYADDAIAGLLERGIAVATRD